MRAALIERFDVPPEDEQAFLADWRRERGATLYRAIRDDTPVRYVGISPGADYELVHEDGAVDGPGGIAQITTFAAPAEADFLAAWHRLRDLLATRRGYLGTRLYRGSSPRFVALTRWSSPLMVFRTQQQPEFHAAALPYPSESALYVLTNNAPRDAEGAI